MKDSVKIKGILICIIILFARPGFASPDLELIRKNVVAGLMQQSVSEAGIKSILDSIRNDGTWPGIDYADVSNTGFQHGQHLTNLVEMSRAFKKEGSKLKGDPRLKKAIYSALNYWLKNDFICQNWWWNQIGTPDQLVKVLLIMDGDLTKEQITKTLPIVGRSNLSASGARPSGDRIKIAGILAKTILFIRDEKMFEDVMKVIAGEIKFETGRGMQYDYSFHHREDRVTSTLSYGLGYADAFAEWAGLVTGTRYSFPDSALNLLIDYYLDGICQTMVHGRYPDPGAENRSITRAGDLRPKSPSTPEKLIKASSYRREELEKIVMIRKGSIKPDLTGNRFYWDSEYFSHQRPGYFTSVRMFSTRNHNMEIPYNSEGLMNHHYADGSNFISRIGDEYFDIFPVYDWQKIPGTTVLQKTSLPSENEIQKRGLTDFVGAVSDGTFGAAAFDFKSPHDPLSAKKAWFFFDKEYVCLGAGINSDSSLNVVTTLNQCLLKGSAMVASGDLKAPVKRGELKIHNANWILHDNTGYLFTDTITVNLWNQPASGSWYKINRQSDSPREEISKDVFKLWIDHGFKPQNANYQYIVIPSTNEKEITAYSFKRDVEIVSNTEDIQAVKHIGLGICQIVFYKSGELQIPEGFNIRIDSPGIVMIRSEGDKIISIAVADPTRKLAKIHFTVSSVMDKTGENYRITRDEVRGTSDVTIDLPQNEYAGKSVVVDL